MYAEYGCTSYEFIDIENALFYNMGTSTFNSMLTKETSVYFQSILPNEIYSCDDENIHYVYHYFLLSKTNQKYWWESDLLCKWDKIPLKKVNSTVKALDYYLAIKNHSNLVQCFDNENEKNLGLKIKLFIPQSSNFKNIMGIMKPMIDGIVCAFHTPDQIDINEISNLLDLPKEYFSSIQNTCIGKRCYINPYRKSVKWDPQDERLEYVFIEPVIVDDKMFSFSGELFVIPCYM